MQSYQILSYDMNSHCRSALMKCDSKPMKSSTVVVDSYSNNSASSGSSNDLIASGSTAAISASADSEKKVSSMPDYAVAILGAIQSLQDNLEVSYCVYRIHFDHNML